MEKLDKEHKIVVDGFELSEEDLVVKREFKCAEPQYEGSVSSDHSFVAAIDTTQDEEIFALGIAREFVNRVQKMRKSRRPGAIRPHQGVLREEGGRGRVGGEGDRGAQEDD